jgi:hypothetical protein
MWMLGLGVWGLDANVSVVGVEGFMTAGARFQEMRVSVRQRLLLSCWLAVDAACLNVISVCIDESIDRPIDQSINQSIDRSIDRMPCQSLQYDGTGWPDRSIDLDLDLDLCTPRANNK